ncbi:MAG: DUF177 domain-containing protein [Negativicutes bacterium]|nr:DUF177 domain-containing protein [Negativicutes bacterium]
MIISVAELKRLVGDQKSACWQEEIAHFDLSDLDMHLLQPVDASILVTNAGDRFLVTGQAAAQLQLTCCRCLVEFQQVLTFDLAEQYLFVPMADVEEDDSEEDADSKEDRFLPVLAADQIDVSRLLIETFFSQLPMKPLCKEECLGLCDQCGANLNEGPCDCHQNVTDPRLAVLSQWRKKNVK